MRAVWLLGAVAVAALAGCSVGARLQRQQDERRAVLVAREADLDLCGAADDAYREGVRIGRELQARDRSGGRRGDAFTVAVVDEMLAQQWVHDTPLLGTRRAGAGRTS